MTDTAKIPPLLFEEMRDFVISIIYEVRTAALG
jgi:hypothetical protein